MDIRLWLFDRVNELQEKAGYSARSLSIAIGRHYDFISKVKTGKAHFSIIDLDKVTRLCNSSLEELFYERFERYKVDKEILQKVSAVDTSESSNALLALFAVLYEERKK